jgi:hypothetical protein
MMDDPQKMHIQVIDDVVPVAQWGTAEDAYRILDWLKNGGLSPEDFARLDLCVYEHEMNDDDVVVWPNG